MADQQDDKQKDEQEDVEAGDALEATRDRIASEMSGEAAGARQGTGAPQVQPGSKAGIDMSEGGGGASTGGPGGPDAGSDAMPGRSNAL